MRNRQIILSGGWLAAVLLCSVLWPSPVAAAQPGAILYHWSQVAGSPTQLQELSHIDELTISGDVVSCMHEGVRVRLDRNRIWRIEWSSAGPVDQPQEKSRILQLGRGDRWTFESIAFKDDAFQIVHRPGQPPISFSLEHVPAVFWSRPRFGTPFQPTPAAAPVAVDRLFLENGDQVQGTLGALGQSELTMQAGFGDLVLPLGQLHELRLNPLLLAASTIPEAAVVIALRDHSVVTVPEVSIIEEGKQLQATLGSGHLVTWPLDQVGSVSFCSAAVRPLTWLPVVEATQESYFGQVTPVLQGAAATGTPMVVSERTYPLGLGVRSGSRVTIELPAAADEFWCLVGLDAKSQGKGIVTIEVAGADAAGEVRAIYPERLLSVETSPFLLGPLNLKGLQTLTLQTHYGPQADILDLIDWCLPTVRVAQSP